MFKTLTAYFFFVCCCTRTQCSCTHKSDPVRVQAPQGSWFTARSGLVAKDICTLLLAACPSATSFNILLSKWNKIANAFVLVHIICGDCDCCDHDVFLFASFSLSTLFTLESSCVLGSTHGFNFVQFLLWLSPRSSNSLPFCKTVVGKRSLLVFECKYLDAGIR